MHGHRYLFQTVIFVLRMNHMGVLFLIFRETSLLFSHWLHYYMPTNSARGLYFLQILDICPLPSGDSHSGMGEVTSHNLDVHVPDD